MREPVIEYFFRSDENGKAIYVGKRVFLKDRRETDYCFLAKKNEPWTMFQTISGFDVVSGIADGDHVFTDKDENKLSFKKVANEWTLLDFTGKVSKPVIKVQPSHTGSVVYGVGENRTLSIDAQSSDGGELGYKWYYSASADGWKDTEITGATDKSYTIPLDTAPGDYKYYCVVTNTRNGASSSLSSDEVKLTIDPAPDNKPDPDREEDGIIYKNGKPVTAITFESNNAKKNEKYDIAVITNTTDPVSWNCSYGADLITTVLFGSAEKEEKLVNNTRLTVNNGSSRAVVEGLLSYSDHNTWVYRIDKVPDTDDKVYIIVGYDLGDKAYVEGHDEVEGSDIPMIPVTSWDGRRINWNKGLGSASTTGTRMILDIIISCVKYDGTTVRELTGIELNSVKLTTKEQNEANIRLATTAKEVTVGNKTVMIREHKKIKDSSIIPSITIKAKITDKVGAYEYKKSISALLKDKKYYFAVMQRGIVAEDPTDVAELGEDSGIIRKWYYDRSNGKITYNKEADQYEGVTASDADAARLSELIMDTFDANASMGETDIKERVDIGGLRISNFTIKNKAKVRIELPVSIINNKGVKTGVKAVALKQDKDYRLKEGSLSGTRIYYLELPEDGNYVYAYDVEGENDLSSFGYKLAFRASPKKEQKGFRRGIYAGTDIGFVN